MYRLLPTACSIDDRRFIQFRIHAGERRHINNAVPAKRLPYIGSYKYTSEISCIAQIIDLFTAQCHQQLGNQPIHTEKIRNHTTNNHCRNEMRQICDSLNGTLEPRTFDLIEQKRQYNGSREPNEQIINTNQQGVSQQANKVYILKKISEMLQPYPLAFKNPLADVEILKSNDHPKHRSITENNIEQYNGDHHNIDILVFI